MTKLCVASLSLVFAVTSNGCGDDETGPEEPLIRSVRYTVVSQDDGVRSKTFSGVVRAGSATRLSFQVSGRVSGVSVTVGDRVTEGQAIAAVDPTDLQLAIQQSRSSAAQARAQLTGASSEYERTRSLYENRNASRSQLDNARAQRDIAQSSLAAAAQATRQLERQLGYASLTAPAAGTISQLSIEPNEVVQAGQVIGILQVGEQLEVAVDLPESFINDIERGQAAEVSIAAANDDDRCNGTVYEVGTPSQGGAVFPVTIRLEDPSDQIRSGMAAEVTFDITGPESTADFLLPAVSVGEDRGGRFVYVVERTGEGLGVVHRRGVEVGELGTEGLEIVSGIESGDLVVTAGVRRIHDGLEVRVPELDADEDAPPEPASEEDEATTAASEGSPE